MILDQLLSTTAFSELSPPAWGGEDIEAAFDAFFTPRGLRAWQLAEEHGLAPQWQAGEHHRWGAPYFSKEKEKAAILTSASHTVVERRGIRRKVLPWKAEQDKNQEQDAYTPRKQTEAPPGKPACVAPP